MFAYLLVLSLSILFWWYLWGNELRTPYLLYRNPPVVSDVFVNALIEAVTDNMVTYDVRLRKWTESSDIFDYKAINIIGLVKAVKGMRIF